MMIDSVFGEFNTNDLIYAAYKGDILDVEHYISVGEFDINDTDDSSYTAMDYAIEGKDVDMIKLLIKAGAKPPKMVADSAAYYSSTAVL